MCSQRDVGSHVHDSGISAHFLDLSPGTAGLEVCDSLFTHPKNKKIIADKFSVRHSLAIQQALGAQELGAVYWLPGLENPAG